MRTLGNIYENGSRHVTQRVNLYETLNWKSLFISPRLSSCRSTNSPVEVNPHGTAEKVKMLLNNSHLVPQKTYREEVKYLRLSITGVGVLIEQHLNF
jgi:hypothetical protein